jgi:hypothetical protein
MRSARSYACDSKMYLAVSTQLDGLCARTAFGVSIARRSRFSVELESRVLGSGGGILFGILMDANSRND